MSIQTRLQKADRVLPPSWSDLWRVAIQAADRMNTNERRALQAINKGSPSDHDQAIFNAWLTKNKARAWAAWDRVYPGWENAPLWESLEETI